MYVSDCILIMLLSYGLGSLPFGVLLAKLFRLPDPRSIGSGNIGATNMLRTGRKDIAALTLLLDMGKGAAAVVLAHFIAMHAAHTPEMEAVGCFTHTAWSYEVQHHCDQLATNQLPLVQLALALLLAAVGHMYSPWLKFGGGKGVATILGAAIALNWPLGASFVVIWLLICYTARYVSLASIGALAVLPLVAWLRIDGPSALIVAIASAIAIWKHRSNIARLRQGFEPRVNFGKGGA